MLMSQEIKTFLSFKSTFIYIKSGTIWSSEQPSKFSFLKMKYICILIVDMQGGLKPWYLEECSSTLATTYSSGTPGQDASIATVDQDAR
jgi:hypothetical protein